MECPPHPEHNTQDFATIISPPHNNGAGEAYHFHVVGKGDVKKVHGHIVSRWLMLVLSATSYSLYHRKV